MIDRRCFISEAGAVLLSGCLGLRMPDRKAKVALQLYSIETYIVGARDGNGTVVRKGVGFDRAFRDLSAMGYRGVEFAGYFGHDAKTLRMMLADNGLVACGTHEDRDALVPEKLPALCDFNMTYGNNLLICPGTGNLPPGGKWTAGRDGTVVTMSAEQEDFVKRLCDFYNEAAKTAAKCGCRIGLHNHTWEFAHLFRDGTTYWDYFFSHTDPAVCMEQDVGWTTCAGYDPCEQFEKYPHRSPTLHAKENGYGSARFDAVLGSPGIREDGSQVKGVDWDSLVRSADRDGVEWFVVECEAHDDDLSAVLPSCDFLRRRISKW